MRFFFYIGIFVSALIVPFPLFVILACVYALIYTPYELLLIGVLIDATFGNAAHTVWCLYTLSVSGIVVVCAILKPYIRFYA